jgi:hypothetical protein
VLLRETEQSEDLAIGERVRGEFTKREVKLARLDATAIALCLVLLQLFWSCSFFLVTSLYVSLEFACLSIWVSLDV